MARVRGGWRARERLLQGRIQSTAPRLLHVLAVMSRMKRSHRQPCKLPAGRSERCNFACAGGARVGQRHRRNCVAPRTRQGGIHAQSPCDTREAASCISEPFT